MQALVATNGAVQMQETTTRPSRLLMWAKHYGNRPRFGDGAPVGVLVLSSAAREAATFDRNSDDSSSMISPVVVADTILGKAYHGLSGRGVIVLFLMPA